MINGIFSGQIEKATQKSSCRTPHFFPSTQTAANRYTTPLATSALQLAVVVVVVVPAQRAPSLSNDTGHSLYLE